jgi:hypothetical protein
MPLHARRPQIVAIYAALGATLALIRVATLIYVNHRMTSHTMSDRIYKLMWVLYPEGLVVPHLPGPFQTLGALYYPAFCLLLVFGSFILPTPVLLIKRSSD